MSRRMTYCWIVGVAGLGVAVGGLAPEVNVPSLVVFAIGLGMILGAVFRGLGLIQAQLKRPTSSG